MMIHDELQFIALDHFLSNIKFDWNRVFIKLGAAYQRHQHWQSIRYSKHCISRSRVDRPKSRSKSCIFWPNWPESLFKISDNSSYGFESHGFYCTNLKNKVYGRCNEMFENSNTKLRQCPKRIACTHGSLWPNMFGLSTSAIAWRTFCYGGKSLNYSAIAN